MAKFHINPDTGDSGACQSTEGRCPFGGDDEHYISITEARTMAEEQLSGTFESTASISKKPSDNLLNFKSRVHDTFVIESSASWPTEGEYTSSKADTKAVGSLARASNGSGDTLIFQKLEDKQWYIVAVKGRDEYVVDTYEDKHIRKVDITEYDPDEWKVGFVKNQFDNKYSF